MSSIRFIFALWASKGARLLLRLLRRNATYFPGYLALKLCPDFLAARGQAEKDHRRHRL